MLYFFQKMRRNYSETDYIILFFVTQIIINLTFSGLVPILKM